MTGKLLKFLYPVCIFLAYYCTLLSATSLEDLAALRLNLEQLYEKVIKSTSQDEEAEHVELCRKKFNLVFDKVGKEVKSYKEETKQLQEERDHYLKEWQHLKGIAVGYYLCIYTKFPSVCK